MARMGRQPKYSRGELLRVRLKASADPHRAVIDVAVRYKNHALVLLVLPESHKVLGGTMIETRDCTLVKRLGFDTLGPKPKPADRGKYNLNPQITRTTSFPQMCPRCRTANTFWHNDICLGCYVKSTVEVTHEQE
jgi:hypothetical protein